MKNTINIKKIAGLARIQLSDVELTKLSQELETILGYIQKLEKLDTADVQPTSHVLPLSNVYREDTVKLSLTQADALKIAVAKEDGAFRVPRIIE